MGSPDALRKHDGRVVAFDREKLAASIARAVLAADPALAPDAAQRLAGEIAHAASAFLAGEGKQVPASADVRAMTVKLLRQTRHDAIADAYAEHSRAATQLLWRLRVVEPGTPSSSPGAPWDRRRLLESLRAAGSARDPAGEAAREVERRVVLLGQERVSPALIHALAAMVLSQRGLDVKTYAARRVGFSLAEYAPRFDSEAVAGATGAARRLPASGPALEAFWLQAVHSPEVVRAVRENTLSLQPYPVAPHEDPYDESGLRACDPLLPEMGAALRRWCAEPGGALCVRADGPERAAELARFLSVLPESLTPPAESGAAVTVLLKCPAHLAAAREAAGEDARSTIRNARPALAVTLNAAGLVVREALRDARVTVRLTQMASLAAQAQREREEYFQLSPVRGRRLPVAVAGIWNAAAWLASEGFECRRLTPQLRQTSANLLKILRGTLETVRQATGMELVLTGHAPPAAARALWLQDREFFRRDGVALDAAGSYDGGPAARLVHGAEDFPERLDFARAAAELFDEPPAIQLASPLGCEPDAAAWRECFAALAQAGIARLQLLPGGSPRGLRSIARSVRSHLEGFPLLEQMLQGSPAREH